jgi:alkylated DNA repair protein alkB family protein 8
MFDMAGQDIQPPPPHTADPTDPKFQRWPDIGLTLIHDFISEAEEAAMVAAFQAATPQSQTGGGSGSGSSRKRLSQHFGHHFDYTTFGASETHFTPVPPYISDLLPRLPVQDYLPDQFTVQYYPPGAGIPPHVDTHSMFGEALYSVSFGGAVPMVFRMSGPNDARKMRLPKRSLLASDANAGTAADAAGAGGTASADPVAVTPASSEQFSTPQGQEQEHPSWELLLPRRSLLLMMGPSRYGYTHGIKGRKTDIIDGQAVAREGRYSITMRTIRRGSEVGCSCDFPGVCDARIREEQARGSTS